MPLALAFTALEIVPLKIAFASLGTPGKQKISVLRGQVDRGGCSNGVDYGDGRDWD